MDIPRVTFLEKKTVQNPLLKYAVDLGWQYVEPMKDLDLRDGEAGIFFLQTFKEKLQEFNPWLTVDDVEEICKDILERTRFNLEGNQKFLNYCRGQVPFYSREQKRNLDLIFFDFKNPQNNLFQVTEELRFTSGKAWNRFDLVFYINGLPILIVETKNPEKEEGINEAIEQIKRYHQESPEFLTYPFLFAVSNFHDFIYGPTWNVETRYLYNWREGKTFEEITKSFFAFERILSFLEDYLIFWEEAGEVKKIVLATHQIRAVEKITKRVLEGEKRQGLIWHTQGSGKTLSMIVAANKLRKIPELENPTILIVVDRIELEEQMGRNLKNYGFPAVEVAESKEKLKELLTSDYRGLILTLIHKFDRIEKELNQRKNIIVFIDEAHRTQEGELAIYMRACLPNGFYFGFTGTPIDKTNIGKGTFLTFGKDDAPQGYLDKYSISDSLNDGTTVPIHYTLAPNKFFVPKDVLEEFYKLIENAAITSGEEEDEWKLERELRLRNLLKSPDRIKKVAEFTAKHFKDYVEPLGFKAFLVGVDREACALLKSELDKYLPSKYSRVVYTPHNRDGELLRKYYLNENEEKEVKKNFLKIAELPKILIVTSKLLTGFDAPILYAMYLDKPMNDHTLLQAIARVNRPLAEKELNNPKTAGLIIDFIGIFEKIEKALRFDSADIQGVIVNLEEKKKEFAELIERGKVYLDLVGDKIDDKTIEKIIDYFADKKSQQEFLNFYKELEGLYEIISPDTFLRPYLNNYFLLSGIVKVLKTHFGTKIPQDLLRKTIKLVQEKTKISELEKTLPIYPINEKTISIIQQDLSPERVKIIKIHRSIKILIENEGPKEPFLFLFRERIERILEEFETKQIGTKEALARFQKLIEEIKNTRKEKERSGLKEKEFAFYYALKNEIKDNRKRLEISQKINQILTQYTIWLENPEITRKLRGKLFSSIFSITKDRDKSLNLMGQLLMLERELELNKKIKFFQKH